MKHIGKYILILFLYISSYSGYTQATFILPDTNFRNCLRELYVKTIDVSGNLVIAEAGKIKGVLNLSNRKISNAEGLQYFINVSEINLSDNNLSNIPQIVHLKNVTILNLASNQINELPVLDKLVNLKSLDIRRNNLYRLPSLTFNTRLVSLIAHSNYLDTLPDLSTLVNLNELNVARNNLTVLPSLDKLISLTILGCWKNKLRELPSLVKLNKLVELNAGYNILNKFPEFSSTSPVSTIYLEFNDLSTLPDLSFLKKLNRVRLYNNALTFEDVYPLRAFSGYDTIFPLEDQEKISIRRNIQIKEHEVLVLETGIDSGVPGTLFTWYYNGDSLTTGIDKLAAFKDFVSESGYYSVKIRHPLFKEMVLYTDSIYVEVLSCINLSAISTVITGSSCLKGGTLSVKPFDQPGSVFTYELKSIALQQTQLSATGVFSNLTESQYVLTIKSGDKCIKQLPNTIEIPSEKCKEVFITPDGDGNDDSYFITYTGKATISDKFGNVVRTLKIPAQWDGTGKSDAINPGLYLININDGQELIKISVLY